MPKNKLTPSEKVRRTREWRKRRRLKKEDADPEEYYKKRDKRRFIK